MLRLRAADSAEAEKWGRALRACASTRLREKLPGEWDVFTMMDYQGEASKTWRGVGKGFVQDSRLVAEVELPGEWITSMQRLIDHTHMCKKTKDRQEREVPLRLEVTQVVGVQNFTAWVKYTKARELLSCRSEVGTSLSPTVLTCTHEDPVIEAALGELDLSSNEHFLFHGTTAAGVQGIAHKDFKLELAGSNRGTLYGKGLYLAECSSKADEYAEEDENGMCRMLLVRAALGRSLVDSAARPDAAELMSKVRTAGYDSLVGDRWAAVGTYREFILFNQGLVYPAYIILYRRTRQVQLLSAISLLSGQQQHDWEAAARIIPTAAALAESHPDRSNRARACTLVFVSLYYKVI
jgi:hypothetical protein